MNTVRIHRHPDCRRCTRHAARHHRLDRLDPASRGLQPEAAA